MAGRRRRLARASLCAGAVLALAAGGLAALDRWRPPPLERAAEVSTVVRARDGELLRAFTTADGAWRLAVRPDAVDPLLLRMLVAYEDRRFRSHPGVDPLAVLRAAG